jgi:hypothetical protein
MLKPDRNPRLNGAVIMAPPPDAGNVVRTEKKGAMRRGAQCERLLGRNSQISPRLSRQPGWWFNGLFS